MTKTKIGRTTLCDNRWWDDKVNGQNLWCGTWHVDGQQSTHWCGWRGILTVQIDDVANDVDQWFGDDTWLGLLIK